MKFYVYNWYKFTIVYFFLLLIVMWLWGYDNLSQLQVILVCSLMALFIHQFEEYVFPGGGPVVINKGNFGERKDYRTYPGNMLSSMIVNNSAWLVYIAAILYPKAIWLGLGTMFFNLFQLVGHGIKMNAGMRTWYNPGLASTVFLLVPVSVWYICFIITHRLATGGDWMLGVAAFIVTMLLTTILPVQLLKDRNTKYVMPEWQVARMNKVQTFASLERKNDKVLTK